MAGIQEQWKPVVGHAGYEVSDHGRVRSMVNGRWGIGRSFVVLTPSFTRAGYAKVNLRGRRQRYVHRLVLEAFVGPCPEGMECLHGPNGTTDNSLGNIRWGTRAENQRDKKRDGTDNCGQKHPLAKLSNEDIKTIRSATGTQSEIGKKFGISQHTVSRIRSGKRWGHLPLQAG